MSKFVPLKEQMDLIVRGTEEIIPIEDLERKYCLNIIQPVQAAKM